MYLLGQLSSIGEQLELTENRGHSGRLARRTQRTYTAAGWRVDASELTPCSRAILTKYCEAVYFLANIKMGSGLPLRRGRCLGTIFTEVAGQS